ncbi:MAG: hypothetical protein NVS4B6_21270 [Mycobacterium sp.]
MFLTNHLPQTRAKLRIDVDDVRRINPDIIYVIGSGFGARGSDRDSGAYGDNIGGITIAGAVAAALFGRQTTGEPSVIDVSLLAVGAWTMQFDVNLALLYGCALPKVRPAPRRSVGAGARCLGGRQRRIADCQRPYR